MNYEYSVKTATGKEFEIRWVSATTVGVTSILYIEFVGHTMVEIVDIFALPEESNYIQGLFRGEVQREYRNYINLIEAIVLAESGNLRIALTAPLDTFGG